MQNLNELLKENKTRLQTILDQLNWTTTYATKTNLTKQTEITHDEELFFPPSCASQNSVVLDTSEMSNLLNKKIAIPQKFSDLQINFSREEKVLLYEHVKSRIETKVPSLDENTDLVAIADIVAMKKREKKNRRKHRVSKPTHTEELRSLVELQMQSLEQHLRNKNGSELATEKNKYDSRKINSKKSEASKSYYNDEHRERKFYRSKHYDEAETSYAQGTKNFTRHRNKECWRSYSKECGRRRSHEHRRNRSKGRDHSKEKFDSNSFTKAYTEHPGRSECQSTNHQKETSSKERSGSKHRRSHSHSEHRRSRSLCKHRRSQSYNKHKTSRSRSKHRKSRRHSKHKRSRSHSKHSRSHSKHESNNKHRSSHSHSQSRSKRKKRA